MKPQLAQSGNRTELDDVIEDPKWVREQKLDGQRLAVRVQNGEQDGLEVANAQLDLRGVGAEESREPADELPDSVPQAWPPRHRRSAAQDTLASCPG